MKRAVKKLALPKSFVWDSWVLRIVALFITLALWLGVFGGKRMELTKRVNLEYILPENLVISNDIPMDVYFRLSGPRLFLKDVESRELNIPVDLANAEAGDYEVILREDMIALPLGIEVVSISQGTVPVKLVSALSRDVPVKAVFGEGLPSQYRVKSVVATPPSVKVRGPQKALDELRYLATEPVFIQSFEPMQELEVRLSVPPQGIRVGIKERTVKLRVELERLR